MTRTPSTSRGTVSSRGSKIDGYALLFDGVNDYVEVGDANVFSVPTTNEITVAAWIRPDTLDFSNVQSSGDGDYVEFLGKGKYAAENQIEYLFRLYNLTGGSRPNRMSFYVFNLNGGIGVGSYFEGGINAPNMKAGEWIHIGGVIDTTQTHIYRNGVLKDSDTYDGTITPANGTAPFRIGTVVGVEGGEPDYFEGAIADVRVYNYALNATEMADLYGGTPPSSGLVGHWDFHEGSGTSAGDISGQGNNGTISGASHFSVSRTNVTSRSSA